MTDITNKHSAPLGLPNGPVVPAGETVAVEKWNDYKDHEVVKAWTEDGTLEVGKIKEAPAKQGDESGYKVVEKSAGWFVVTRNGEEVTKRMRKDALDGFDAKPDDEKTAFVEANKAD